jgi:predicted aspartyl protease
MAITFNYEKNHSSILGDVYRPVASASFYSKKKDRWFDVGMIVDTGADYTVLPRHFARRLGINLKQDCDVFKTSGVGGESKVHFLKEAKVRLGSWERIIPVGFLDHDNIPPLLGRYAFLETFDAHFSKRHTLTLKG